MKTFPVEKQAQRDQRTARRWTPHNPMFSWPNSPMTNVTNPSSRIRAHTHPRVCARSRTRVMTSGTLDTCVFCNHPKHLDMPNVSIDVSHVGPPPITDETARVLPKGQDHGSTGAQNFTSYKTPYASTT